MHKQIKTGFISLVLLLILLISGVQAQQNDNVVVEAVLFYSPSCPHCHEVINNLLIPMMAEYPGQLDVAAIDVSQPDGGLMYQAAIAFYQIPPEREGVPTLIVGDTILVGSGEIPDQFPGIVADGLAGEGIAYPALPGFTPPNAKGTGNAGEVNNTGITTPADVEAAGPPADPIGMTLAGIILGAMVVMLLFVSYQLWRHWPTYRPALMVSPPTNAQPVLGSWLFPVLIVAGLGVAGYLAYVELTHTAAVCGPVGSCNEVQSSEYAQILGIPIAVLGLAFYSGALILWGLQKFVPAQWQTRSPALLLVLTIGGTLFSIYLTILEIAVIHAVCAWCLTSAVITTALLFMTFAAINKLATQGQSGSGSGTTLTPAPTGQ